ncbi:MAG: FAD-dependent oxidoreductase [Candidatus Omnitrophica bacterium]|nr:FAD-dependent oxidoreductase [Candidatus Omnitrophota bacterium]
MPKIIIIGSSIAGHTAAISLRQKNKDCEITLITDEPSPCYDKRKLPAYLAGGTKEKELYLVNADHYAGQNIKFLKERKVYGINTNRRLVYFKYEETRGNAEYDFLVICSGVKTTLPDIPGINKEGVIRLDSLNDFKQARKYLLSSDTVCFLGWNPWAQEIAKAITGQQKEVKAVTEQPVEGPAQMQHLEFINSKVTDIIGESGVQAIKLKEGKIIGASLVVVFDSPAKPAVDFLKDTDIELSGGGVCVDANLRTNLKNVFACGAAAGAQGLPDKTKNWDDVLNESVRLADNISQAIGGLNV